MMKNANSNTGGKALWMRALAFEVIYSTLQFRMFVGIHVYSAKFPGDLFERAHVL